MTSPLPSCRRGAKPPQGRHNKLSPSYRRGEVMQKAEGRSYTCEPFRVNFYVIAKIRGLGIV